MVDKCVCCGTYVPEGRQVCYSCAKEANQLNSNITITKPRLQKRSFISLLRGVLFGI